MDIETQHSGDTAVAEKQEIIEPSQYKVIVHNNDDTTYDEVVYIISKTFQMEDGDAFNIALTVDKEGKGVCGVYPKEIAEAKLLFVEIIKDSLVSLVPARVREIKLLEFTMEKA